MNLVLAVLLSQLGADDFQTRERAQDCLNRLGPAAHIHLAIGEKSNDPEIRVRSKSVLDRWHSENAETLAGAHCYFPFWLWDADCSRQEMRIAYLQAAREIVGVCSRPDWFDERLATQLLVTDMYRARRPQVEIDECLCIFWEREMEWRSKFGSIYGLMPLPFDLPR